VWKKEGQNTDYCNAHSVHKLGNSRNRRCDWEHRRLLIRFALGGIFITALATQPCGKESIGPAGISNTRDRNSMGGIDEQDRS